MYLLSFCLVANISLLSSSLTSTGGESTSLPPFPSLSSPSSDGGLHSGHTCTNSSTFKGTKDYRFETTKQGSFPRACHCSVCVCLTSGAVDWRPVCKVSSFPPLPDETQSDVDHCMHEGESYQNECVRVSTDLAESTGATFSIGLGGSPENGRSLYIISPTMTHYITDYMYYLYLQVNAPQTNIGLHK